MKTQFDYMFQDNPSALDELNELGITFEEVDWDGSGEPFPALKLPSGVFLVIMRDDEGNGPGSLHVFEDL
jgi:hypothetical protein